jgi:plastocyanin
MKHLLEYAVLLVVLAGLLQPRLAFAAKKMSVQTYTVMVGLEKPNKGIGVMAYFPRSVTIHKGDTVHWVQNSNEIHTVTFPDGILPPDLLMPSDEVPGADPAVSPLVFTPFVVNQSPLSGSEYSGGIGGFANSGIMGREPGQVEEYDLTFVSEGTFGYFCVVHGFAMSGEVVVVSDDQKIASPNQSMAEGRKQMAEALSLVPAVVRDAAGQVTPPEMNGDGTMSHTVMVGYSETVTASYGDLEIDLMQFFPDKLTVRPGDTLTFEMSANNVAPHTATFLNGAEEPALAVFQNGFLYLNSEVVFPSSASILTRSGVFNSGLMLPVPGTTFSLTIGDMKPGLEHFSCLLHDSSGMEGELMVLPHRSNSD